jgi:membrane protein YdbS with pleckstrin-like domain
LVGSGYRLGMPFPRRLLADDEKLVLDLRPHWIGLVMPILETALIVAAVILALVYLPDSAPTWTRWLIVLAGIVLFVAQPFGRILAWTTSHFVITSDRLIHRSGWFAKRSMEIPLENISDVRFTQGVLERLIGAGSLVIESPGEFGQETFDEIRGPERVQKIIYETGEENRRRMVSPAPGAGSASVADELAKLDRLHRDGVINDKEFQAQKSRLLGSS